MLSRARQKLNGFRALASAIGTRTAINYRIYHRMGHWAGDSFPLRPKQVLFPLLVRRVSSDIDVFNQIFIEREYECLDEITNARLIIDCGANVGYTSAYFLSTHPQSRVIAVEPDIDNFAVLQRNLAPYGSRATCVRGGVWSRETGLVMSQQKFRDGREWSRHVRPCEPDEDPSFKGFDIASLLAKSGFDRISILKMDVEGAEAVIFSSNFKPWLDKVDAIAIELHDDSPFGRASDIFYSTIADQDFDISRSGELTICRRNKMGRSRELDAASN